MIKLRLISLIILLIIGCEQPVENRPIDKDKIEKDSTEKNSIEIERVTTELQTTVPVIASNNNEKPKANATLPSSVFMQAEWTDLIPEDDLEVLLNPPSYLDDIVDGSVEDKLSNKFKNEINQVDEDRYQQALTSTRVKAIVNNAPIRIPAFIVPLEFDDEQKVTQFFMVPYYGACIHLPPPPPNQTIFVNYAKGIKLESLYEPYWVSGIIKTSLVENDTATAAYSMEMHAFEAYTDE